MPIIKYKGRVAVATNIVKNTLVSLLKLSPRQMYGITKNGNNNMNTKEPAAPNTVFKLLKVSKSPNIIFPIVNKMPVNNPPVYD